MGAWQRSANAIASLGLESMVRDDSFIFEEDGRIIGAALDVREDCSFHLNAEVLAETLDQIVAHWPWCRRCV